MDFGVLSMGQFMTSFVNTHCGTMKQEGSKIYLDLEER